MYDGKVTNIIIDVCISYLSSGRRTNIYIRHCVYSISAISILRGVTYLQNIMIKMASPQQAGCWPGKYGILHAKHGIREQTNADIPHNIIITIYVGHTDVSGKQSRSYRRKIDTKSVGAAIHI